jgi:hypothetical protein
VWAAVRLVSGPRVRADTSILATNRIPDHIVTSMCRVIDQLPAAERKFILNSMRSKWSDIADRLEAPSSLNHQATRSDHKRNSLSVRTESSWSAFLGQSAQLVGSAHLELGDSNDLWRQPLWRHRRSSSNSGRCFESVPTILATMGKRAKAKKKPRL